MFRGVFKEKSMYKYLFASILLTGLGYGLYKGVIDNYLAEVVTMSEFDRGVSEFFRELPGLALVGILALFYEFSAEKIYKIGAVIMVIGMGMHFVLPADRIYITLAIFVYSLGEHIQLGMKNALTLDYAEKDKGGNALGLQKSVSEIGTLFGYLIVMVAFMFLSGVNAFKGFFVISTLIIGISMVLSFKLTGNVKQDSSKQRFYFNKKFTKYYFLEVFYGARKQVFFTFGPYVLILFYQANTAVISMLYAISAVCCFFMAPVVGKIIDKFGYKIVMISDTLILVGVCAMYGFAHHFFPMKIAFVLCCIAYVLDAVISLASMASNVYVQDIADNQEEVRATISTGISVNHAITIFIALFGGWIWKTLGIETLFMLSAFLGICNSIYAATIKTSKEMH
ncbi:MAG: MFS transporter [Erysipelotrichaceae bacterium]|nr:MFS transporter [Erysipelotrichaceae bacterium]